MLFHTKENELLATRNLIGDCELITKEMIDPENVDCLMHDLLVHIGIWMMDLVGDEYICYRRPSGQPWTPLYRFSIRVNMKDLKNPELLPTSGRTLDLIETINETLNADGSMQLEVRRSGMFMSWLYDYLAKRYYFPLSDLCRAIRASNEGYEISNILGKALGLKEPLTRPRFENSSSSDDSSEEERRAQEAFDSYNYRSYRISDDSSEEDEEQSRDEDVKTIDAKRLEAVLDDVLSRSPDIQLDENDNYG